VGSPVVARRRLGAELRKLRELAGVTVAEAARALECSPSKISRLETGLGVPRSRDVRDLIELIGGEARARRAELLELAEEGRTAAWYDELGVVEPGSLAHRLIGLEASASEVLIYGGSWLPGLVQTPAYAAAVYRAARHKRTDAEIEALVDLRMRRKGVLSREPNPMRLTAILDESALVRWAGGPEVMREQLESLQEAVTNPRPNVELRLLPFSAGLHRLVAGDLTVLRFDGDDPDIAVTEGHGGVNFEERSPEVEPLIEDFHSGLELSVGGDDFAKRLADLARSESLPGSSGSSVSSPRSRPVR